MEVEIIVKFFPANNSEDSEAGKVFQSLREKWKDRVRFDNVGVAESRNNTRIELKRLGRDKCAYRCLTYKPPIEFNDVESGIYHLGGFERRTAFDKKQEIVEEVIEKLSSEDSGSDDFDSEDDIDELFDDAGLDDPPDF